jgi:hypothetical protein
MLPESLKLLEGDNNHLMKSLRFNLDYLVFKRTRRAIDYINKEEVVRIGLNNKQQTVELGHQHADTIQHNSPVGLRHQHDTTLTTDTECPNKHRQRQPHTRAHKTAKDPRCQAMMQSIQQL